MANAHLISTDCRPSRLSHLIDQMQREPSLQTLASLSPITLQNWTSQTWSLCALSVAIQCYGITSVEHWWSVRRENLSTCMLWKRQWFNWWVSACDIKVSRRFGWSIELDYSTYWTFSIKFCRPAFPGPNHQGACFYSSDECWAGCHCFFTAWIDWTATSFSLQVLSFFLLSTSVFILLLLCSYSFSSLISFYCSFTVFATLL